MFKTTVYYYIQCDLLNIMGMSHFKDVFSNNCPCAQVTCAHVLALFAALIV